MVKSSPELIFKMMITYNNLHNLVIVAMFMYVQPVITAAQFSSYNP